MSRSMALALGILCAAAVSGRAEPVAPFKDLPARHWAFPEVDWLRRDGALVGWDGAFHGKTPLNRYQAAEVLSRTLRIHYADRDRIDRDLARVEAGLGARRSRLAGVRSTTEELARSLAMPSWTDAIPAATGDFERPPATAPAGPAGGEAGISDPDAERSARIRALREAYAARRADRETERD